MAQDPVVVVRDQFDATNARDFARAMDIYADDVVLVVAPNWGLNAGTYEGKEAVGEWFGDWFRQFSHDYHFEITDARDLGSGLVLMTANHGGSGRTSGVAVDSESGYLYRVEDGKITRLAIFVTPEEATEAASLPEWSQPETG